MKPHSQRSRAALAALAAAACVAWLRSAPAAPAPAHPGPTLAVEDTMHTEVPPVLVSAPRVTLDEILDRVARGEAKRDSSLHDESFLSTMRIVGHAGSAGAQQLLEERLMRVYKKRPGHVREVELRHWFRKPPKKPDDDSGVRVEAGPGMGEDIVNFAFQPESRRNYRYHIAGRQLLGDHLIYQLAFEPLSPIDVFEPSGLVWVDTRDFVIVRQEISFRASPVPMIVRAIPRMVVERMPVGDTWVLSRILMRVQTTIPFPGYGRDVDIGVAFTDYTLNTGLPDSLFAPAGKGRRGEAGR